MTMFVAGQKVTVWENPHSPHIVGIDTVCITDSDGESGYFSLTDDPGPNFSLSNGKHRSSFYNWVTPWEPAHDIIIERAKLAYDLCCFNFHDTSKLSLEKLKEIHALVFPSS